MDAMISSYPNKQILTNKPSLILEGSHLPVKTCHKNKKFMVQSLAMNMTAPVIISHKPIRVPRTIGLARKVPAITYMRPITMAITPFHLLLADPVTTAPTPATMMRSPTIQTMIR